MPEEIVLLILSILVIVAVALFKKFAIAVEGLGALLATVLACVIAGAVESYIVGGNVLSFIAACLIIYAVSNLLYQLFTQARKLSKL